MDNLIDIGGTFFTGLADGAASLVGGFMDTGTTFADWFNSGSSFQTTNILDDPNDVQKKVDAGFSRRDVASGLMSGVGAYMQAQESAKDREAFLQRKQMELQAERDLQSQRIAAQETKDIGQIDGGLLGGVKQQRILQQQVNQGLINKGVA